MHPASFEQTHDSFIGVLALGLSSHPHAMCTPTWVVRNVIPEVVHMWYVVQETPECFSIYKTVCHDIASCSACHRSCSIVACLLLCVSLTSPVLLSFTSCSDYDCLLQATRCHACDKAASLTCCMQQQQQQQQQQQHMQKKGVACSCSNMP